MEADRRTVCKGRTSSVLYGGRVRTLYPASSLHLLPSFPCLLSPCSSPGRAPGSCWSQPGPPPSPLLFLPDALPARLPASSAARAWDCCWRRGRFVCSQALREISTINGQQHSACSCSIDLLPGRAGGWTIGR